MAIEFTLDPDQRRLRAAAREIAHDVLAGQKHRAKPWLYAHRPGEPDDIDRARGERLAHGGGAAEASGHH